MHEELERELVDYYNEYRPLFDNIPPYYSIPIPEAEIKEDHERKEYKNTTFDVDSEKFKNNLDSSMCASVNKNIWKTTIYINPTYYHYSSNLSGLLLFPPLHEMVHIKQAVLKSKGSEFKCENSPTVDFSITKELFEDLQSMER